MSSAAAATTVVVEHVVLFKVRESTDSSKIESNLQSLSSLDMITHHTACPILPPRSPTAAGFTHLLHCRYRSKADLATYDTHPDHVVVIKANALICDDLMSVNWVAEIDGPVALPPGSAARLTLAKPREGVTAAEVVAVLDGVKATPLPSDWQLSYEENFSPTAKGYSVGFITVVPGVEELAGNEIIEALKEKVRPLLESAIVIDFVIPEPASASS